MSATPTNPRRRPATAPPHRLRRAAAAVTGAAALTVLTPLLSVSPASATESAVSLVSRSVSGSVELEAGAGTANDVQVFVEAGQLTIIDTAGVQAGTGCILADFGLVRCGTGVTNVGLFLGDGDDEVSVQTGIATTVFGESGNDVFRAGLAGSDDSTVFYDGGLGFDTVDYGSADTGVTVTVGDAGVGNDGRPGDRDSVQSSVEEVVGSTRPDRLTGDALDNLILGGGGPDVLIGGGGDDLFDEGGFANGGDDISGGTGRDTVLYLDRAADLRISLDGVADDGASNELDNVRTDIEIVATGAGDDLLIGGSKADELSGGDGVNHLIGRGGPDELSGGAAADRLDGGKGDDQLLGGPGVDTANGGGGNDAINARDGAAELVSCGSGNDAATLDVGLDAATRCESVG